MSDNPGTAVAFLFLMTIVLLVGVMIGSKTEEERSVRATVIECVTKPTVCKTRYDYYQLKGANQ